MSTLEQEQYEAHSFDYDLALTYSSQYEGGRRRLAEAKARKYGKKAAKEYDSSDAKICGILEEALRGFLLAGSIRRGGYKK